MQCRKAHTHFETCGTACPRTCDNYAVKFIICTDNCVTDCFCDKGFVLDANKNCIAISDCPGKSRDEAFFYIFKNNDFIFTVKPVCKANEEHSQCGANGCQNSCADPTFETRCRGICTEGCICVDGYVRNDDGVCTKLEECPSGSQKGSFSKLLNFFFKSVKPVCSAAHEVYSDCGAYCQPICSQYVRDCAAPFQDCNPGCVCEAGYIRNGNDECIKREDCPCN